MRRLPRPYLVCTIVWLLAVIASTGISGCSLIVYETDNSMVGIVDGALKVQWREAAGRYPSAWWPRKGGIDWPVIWVGMPRPTSSIAGGFVLRIPIWTITAAMLAIVAYRVVRELATRRDIRRGFEPVMRGDGRHRQDAPTEVQ